jgi:hypothetical protein
MLHVTTEFVATQITLLHKRHNQEPKLDEVGKMGTQDRKEVTHIFVICTNDIFSNFSDFKSPVEGPNPLSLASLARVGWVVRNSKQVDKSGPFEDKKIR